MAARPMVHLTTVAGTFHARVVVARLGAEGILTELHGDSGATYPLRSVVHVFVDPDQAEAARHILLADEAAAALDAPEEPHVAPAAVRDRRSLPRRTWFVMAWVLIGVLVALYLLAMLG